MVISLIPITAQSDDRIRQNRADGRLYQALYHLHAQSDLSDEANHLMGDIYAQLGDLPRAVAYWERAHLTDAVHLSALAQGYMTLEDWAGAVDTLWRILTIAPADEWASWQLGAILAPSNHPQALRLLAEARLSARYGASAQAMITALSAGDTPSDRAMLVGIALANLGEWRLSERAFREAATIGDDGGVALAYIGLARHMQGKRAEQWFARAIQIAPQTPQIYYLYGLYQRDRGEIQASIATFSTAISLMPQNPAYYVELGLAYGALGDHAQADYWLQFAVSMSGNDARFRAIVQAYYAQQQQAVFDFDALRALMEATPAVLPESTLEHTPMP